MKEMGKKKNFLPVSTHDVELPFMSGGPAAAVAAMGGVGVYRDTVTQNRRGLPKAIKTKSWVMNMFLALTVLGTIFGSTIVGFSFKMISDNQVGYYNSEPGYMGPGTYFQFPWTKEEMKIVDVGLEFMKIERLVGVLKVNNQEFMIQNANVIYNVSDVDKYIQTLKDVKSPVYCHTEIENAVRDDVVRTAPEKLPSLKELNDIPVTECGMTIKRAILSGPSITHKTPLVVNIAGAQQPRVTNQTQDREEEDTTPKPSTTTTTTQPPVEDVSEPVEEPDTDTTTTQPPEEDVPVEEPDTDTNSTLSG
jgi:hypothetical protein